MPITLPTKGISSAVSHQPQPPASSAAGSGSLCSAIMASSWPAGKGICPLVRNSILPPLPQGRLLLKSSVLPPQTRTGLVSCHIVGTGVQGCPPRAAQTPNTGMLTSGATSNSVDTRDPPTVTFWLVSGVKGAGKVPLSHIISAPLTTYSSSSGIRGGEVFGEKGQSIGPAQDKGTGGFFLLSTIPCTCVLAKKLTIRARTQP